MPVNWENTEYGEQAYHLAALITNLTSELTILTNGNSGIDSVHARKLGKHRVSIVETEIDKIVHENGYVKSILFRDGVAMDYEAVYAIVPFKQHCDIPARLGCEFISSGRIKVNNSCQTTIDGVYACGDNTSASRSIAKAVYAGNLTGAMVNKALLAEDW
jgi:thioredoxin reductase